MHDANENSDEPSLVSVRTMDIAVAILFMVAAGVVIYDSTRLGFGWRPNEGPAAGYFPFYIALTMAGASVVNLFRALRIGHNAHESFVSKPAFNRVLAILVPSFVYVGVIGFLGIYVASAMFIIAFMLTLGKEGIIRSLAIGIGVPIVLFVMFEIYFLVPLPKGPLEAMIGY
jgi:putative tricarboxylic transport membrane protein